MPKKKTNPVDETPCPHPARSGRHEVYMRKDGSLFCRACGDELELPKAPFIPSVACDCTPGTITCGRKDCTRPYAMHVAADAATRGDSKAFEQAWDALTPDERQRLTGFSRVRALALASGLVPSKTATQDIFIEVPGQNVLDAARTTSAFLDNRCMECGAIDFLEDENFKRLLYRYIKLGVLRPVPGSDKTYDLAAHDVAQFILRQHRLINRRPKG